MNLPGQRYIDPRMNYANQLIKDGSNTAPVQHWAQGLGRLGQALAGAYMKSKYRGQENEAYDRFLNPGNFVDDPATKQNLDADLANASRPTDASVQYQGPGKLSQALAQNAPASKVSYNLDDNYGPTTKPLPDDQLMQMGNMPHYQKQIAANQDLLNMPPGAVEGALEAKAQKSIDFYADRFNRDLPILREENQQPIQPQSPQMPDMTGLPMKPKQPPMGPPDGNITMVSNPQQQYAGIDPVPKPQPMQPQQPQAFTGALSQKLQENRNGPTNFQANVEPPQQSVPQMSMAQQSMEALRGMQNNPIARQMMMDLRMQEMQQGKADALYQRGRNDTLSDTLRAQEFTANQNQLNRENKRGIADIKRGSGPYAGTSMDAQNSNILLNGNPNTPEYRAAYAMMAQPKVHFDPTTQQMISVNPDMSPYQVPGGGAGAVPVQGRGQRPGQPTVSVSQGTGRTKPYPEFQSKSAGFYNRMLDANSELKNVFAGPDGVPGNADDLSTSDVYSSGQYAANSIPGVGNALASPEFQRAQQAQRNWVSANLRLESGAAIPPEEMENEFKKYFPVYGDSEAVIEQKARSRETVEHNMMTQSQGAYGDLYKNSQRGRRNGESQFGQGGPVPLDTTIPNQGPFGGRERKRQEQILRGNRNIRAVQEEDGTWSINGGKVMTDEDLDGSPAFRRAIESFGYEVIIERDGNYFGIKKDGSEKALTKKPIN